MRIEGKPPAEAAAAYNKMHERAGQNKPSTAQSDRAEISPAARDLARLAKAAAIEPRLREELVQRIRQELALGTYRVDQEALARKISRELER